MYNELSQQQQQNQEENKVATDDENIGAGSSSFKKWLLPELSYVEERTKRVSEIAAKLEVPTSKTSDVADVVDVVDIADVASSGAGRNWNYFSSGRWNAWDELATMQVGKVTF